MGKFCCLVLRRQGTVGVGSTTGRSGGFVVFCGVFLQGALLGNIAALLVGQLDSVDSAARPVLEMLI